MKKTLCIEEQDAKRLYPESAGEFRKKLEEVFGKKAISGNITERVKSYKDACCELGIDPGSLLEVEDCPSDDQRSIIAYHKLCIITRALNEGWRPDWDNSSEWKYFPWFKMSPSGFACDATYNWHSNAIAGAGSRLCFKTRALAEYAGKQFIDLYRELMIF